MLTRSARRSLPRSRQLANATVVGAAEFQRRSGWSDDAVLAQLHARRWRRIGRVLVLHDGPLTQAESRRVALLNAGPRALLTAFTAAELLGLKGWGRSEVHLLVPSGARVRTIPFIPTRVHYTGDWTAVESHPTRRLQALAPALVVAASTFPGPRPACGILAAGVQQRLVTADQLNRTLELAPRVRHRAALVAAVADIAQGSEALSEIDFVRLCRRYHLPMPTRQSIRRDSTGRRRYLDAEWVRGDGRVVIVEVDGALHLSVRQWWSDQSRQNELALSGDMILRFPSVTIRTDPAGVAAQLRRALQI